MQCDLTDNSKEMREIKRPRYLLMVSKAAVIRVGEEKLVKFAAQGTAAGSSGNSLGLRMKKYLRNTSCKI